MSADALLLRRATDVALVTAGDEGRREDVPVAATRDHDLVRRWAIVRGARPATGEETASGAATVNVNDGDTGLRFNFPAAARFRPIDWDEWFAHFERHELVFVFERKGPNDNLSYRYRLLPMRELTDGQNIV